MSDGSLWLRTEHLPGVVEAPASIPSMTNRKQKERQKTSKEETCSIEEVGSSLMLSLREAKLRLERTQSSRQLGLTLTQVCEHHLSSQPVLPLQSCLLSFHAPEPLIELAVGKKRPRGSFNGLYSSRLSSFFFTAKWL